VPPKPATPATYLKAASPRYRANHAALGKAVRRVFPRARPVFLAGMPGWMVARPQGAPRPARAGPWDLGKTAVLFAEGKGGLTAHVWYPGAYDLLARHREALTAAGLKLGRGCLVWTRQGDFPVEALEQLLREARRADGSGPLRR
jgi:hypothetical protein